MDLHQLLDLADEGPGLSIHTNNARRLMIDLRHAIKAAQRTHPEAYASLILMTSRSPLEIYIVKRSASPALTNSSPSAIISA